MRFLTILACLLVYFLPSMIAFWRKKRAAAAILMINLFFGITILGWILAMGLVFKPDTFFKRPSKQPQKSSTKKRKTR